MRSVRPRSLNSSPDVFITVSSQPSKNVSGSHTTQCNTRKGSQYFFDRPQAAEVMLASRNSGTGIPPVPAETSTPCRKDSTYSSLCSGCTQTSPTWIIELCLPGLPQNAHVRRRPPKGGGWAGPTDAGGETGGTEGGGRSITQHDEREPAIGAMMKAIYRFVQPSLSRSRPTA